MRYEDRIISLLDANSMRKNTVGALYTSKFISTLLLLMKYNLDL